MDEDAGAEVVSKHPKRKRPPKKTVEQNLGNINSSESERRCEVQRHRCTVTGGQDRAGVANHYHC